MQVISSILSNALLVTILVILVSSLIGFYVKMRSRDRCLRDFHDFRVTVETQGGEVAWGDLRVYSSGIELLYTSNHKDTEGRLENSYILYASELANLQALYRFHDHETSEQRRLRERDIRQTYQPSIFRRAGRGVRNTFSTFKDAIVQALNAILGARAVQNPQDLVLSQHKALTDSGSQLLSGTVGTAYEPILENYIGQYVVLEILRGDTLDEEYGILKEYSAQYVEILNVKLEVPLRVYLQGRTPSAPDPVKVERDAGVVRVSHELERTLVVDTIHCGERSRKVSVAIDPEQTVEIQLTAEEMDAPDSSAIEPKLRVRCLADLIAPRALAVVRHAGKREKPSWDAVLGLDELSHRPWMRRLIGTRQDEHLPREV
jgi:hypothetical protein